MYYLLNYNNIKYGFGKSFQYIKDISRNMFFVNTMATVANILIIKPALNKIGIDPNKQYLIAYPTYIVVYISANYFAGTLRPMYKVFYLTAKVFGPSVVTCLVLYQSYELKRTIDNVYSLRDGSYRVLNEFYLIDMK